MSQVLQPAAAAPAPVAEPEPVDITTFIAEIDEDAPALDDGATSAAADARAPTPATADARAPTPATAPAAPDTAVGPAPPEEGAPVLATTPTAVAHDLTLWTTPPGVKVRF